MDNNTTQTLLIVFIAVATVSILIQACVMVAMAVGARKTQKKVMALAEDVRLHALPVIMSSRELLQETGPKIKSILEDLTAMSASVRGKTEQITSAVGDVTARAHVQAARVDGMLKGTLDGVTAAVQAIEHGVAGPVRQVNGLINGLRAGVEVLRSKTPVEPPKVESEADLFV